MRLVVAVWLFGIAVGGTISFLYYKSLNLTLFTEVIIKDRKIQSDYSLLFGKIAGEPVVCRKQLEKPNDVSASQWTPYRGPKKP